MRNGILAIQLSNSEAIFRKSTELYLIKWLEVGDEQVTEFLNYFKQNFIDEKAGWYEGYSIGDPSQSNGIESSHKHLKSFENIKT